MSGRSGHAVIEEALAAARRGNWLDSPFGTSPEEGHAYVAGLAAAYQHALEMIPVPAEPAPDQMDALRRTIAEMLGYDPETWPSHGNAPLAITSAVALLKGELRPPEHAGVFLWQGEHRVRLTAPQLMVEREVLPGMTVEALCRVACERLAEAQK